MKVGAGAGSMEEEKAGADSRWGERQAGRAHNGQGTRRVRAQVSTPVANVRRLGPQHDHLPSLPARTHLERVGHPSLGLEPQHVLQRVHRSRRRSSPAAAAAACPSRRPSTRADAVATHYPPSCSCSCSAGFGCGRLVVVTVRVEGHGLRQRLAGHTRSTALPTSQAADTPHRVQV